MKVYFSCSLTGGRDYEEVYRLIVEHLLESGHEVPTAHLASPDVMEVEKVVDANEVYHRDIEWIDHCDAVIAEVSTPSHGVGYEIAYALGQGKPVFCCYKRGVNVSKMIVGNDSPNITVIPYDDGFQVPHVIDTFFDRLKGA